MTVDMTAVATSDHDLATQLGSVIAARMCHDLISPIGAIGNGVELLELAGGRDGAELELVSESIAQAQARVRFFRLAYGEVGADQRIKAQEVRSILGALTRGRPLRIEWAIDGDMPRRDVKLAFLLIQCLESALVRGGSITISPDQAGRWRLDAQGKRLRLDDALWRQLGAREARAPLRPNTVQFALAALHCQSIGASLDVRHELGAEDDGAIDIRFHCGA